MKQEPKRQFAKQGDDPGLPMMKIISQAKATVAEMTGLPIDAIVQCQRVENLNWGVSVDVIEAPARIGDNDLLATYCVEMTPAGDMQAFSRTRRYHREDRDA